MPSVDTDELLWFADRWWWFHGSRIGGESEFEWRDGRVHLLESDGTTVEGIAMPDHDCCYIDCPEPGAIHIGKNGGDSHWICFRHFDLWNQTRARLISEGAGCVMQELGNPQEE